MSKGLLFVVSAPSGAGKTTLVHMVLERLESQYPIKRAVTYTSKVAGHGEQNGIDYHFVTADVFQEKIRENFFVEHSTAYGSYYGLPVTVFEEIDKGNFVIAIVDRQGAQSIKKARKDAVLIWIKPFNADILKERLVNRSREDQAAINFRLSLAHDELTQSESLFEHVIINENLNSALDHLEAIIKQSISRLRDR